MTVERWAQQIIEKELDCPVVVHDDGSQPSMYDLRIGAVEAPTWLSNVSAQWILFAQRPGTSVQVEGLSALR